ncbi:MAG: hypothetical protein O9341_07290 [Paucibacter sp.]|nr:hypothetical protein [Roseateles sp.]
MLLKNALTFCHLLAMALAVGKMLDYDVRFLWTVHTRPTPQRLLDLERTKSTMTLALIALWLSGAALVYVGHIQNPTYLMNEKLWMKVFTVLVLTLNGWLMHRFAFPVLQRGHAFLEMPVFHMLGLTLFATLSSVSWLYASFLGIARSWNHTAPFGFILGVYATLILVAGVTAMLGITLLRQIHMKRPPFSHPADTDIEHAGCPH